MSLTAAIWILLFLFLAVRSLSQPIYGVCLYMLTFFAAPQFWWWGEGILLQITDRWNLIAALILAVSVLINYSNRPSVPAANGKAWRGCFAALFLFTVNAVVVHFGWAAEPDVSWTSCDLAIKQLFLAFLLYSAIQSKQDLLLCLAVIFVGCSIVGYQVVVNEAGSFTQGRLEGIGIPGTSNSNGVSMIMLTGICTGGYFFLSSKRFSFKVASALFAALNLDTVLRCNSRGAFLGLACAGVWMAVATRGKSRQHILCGLALGVAAVLLQAQDANIWSRFGTTFNSAEDRDGSASGRIEYWKASLKMIADYPLGSGGESAFKSQLGMSYITHIRQDEFRAVHNGYLDIAAGWGIQGTLLLGFSLASAFWGVWKVTRANSVINVDIALMGATIQAMFVSQLVTTIFLSRLDHEVFYWIVVLCAAYYREYYDSDDMSVSDDLNLEDLDLLTQESGKSTLDSFGRSTSSE